MPPLRGSVTRGRLPRRVGILATGALLVAGIVAPLLDPQPLQEGDTCPLLDVASWEGRSMEYKDVDPAGVGVAIGIALFCFSGHATFPELYRQVRRRGELEPCWAPAPPLAL